MLAENKIDRFHNTTCRNSYQFGSVRFHPSVSPAPHRSFLKLKRYRHAGHSPAAHVCAFASSFLTAGYTPLQSRFRAPRRNAHSPFLYTTNWNIQYTIHTPSRPLAEITLRARVEFETPPLAWLSHSPGSLASLGSDTKRSATYRSRLRPFYHCPLTS